MLDVGQDVHRYPCRLASDCDDEGSGVVGREYFHLIGEDAVLCLCGPREGLR